VADETENVIIKVSQTGVAEVTAALDSVGASGEAAGASVAKGMQVAGDGLTAAQRGALAASSAYGAFASQLSQVTAAAATAAKGAIDLGEAHTVSAEGAKASAAAQEALVAAARAATEAMVAEGAAAIELSAQMEIAAGATRAAGEAATVSVGSFRAMNGAFVALAAVIGVAEFVKFSDAATVLDNTLKHITATTGDYNQVLQSLSTTANRTGLPLNDLSKLMFSLDVAVKGTSVSHQTLEKAISGVASALQISGTSSDHATRALRDITEAVAQGSLQGRQFTTILVQVPGVMEAIEQATGKTAAEIIGMGNSHKAASATIKTANTEIGVSHDQLTAKLTANVAKAKANDLALSLSSTATAAEQTKAHQKVLTSQTQLTNEQARLSAAGVDAQTKAAAQVSALANKTNIDVLNILANGSDNLAKQAAQMQLTFHQAFTVLGNDFETYVLSVNKATDANGILVKGILTIGDNLNVIIPLVVAFGAAWAAVQAVATIKALTVALVEFGTLMTATIIPAVVRFGAAALFAFGPIGAAITIVIGLVVTLAAKLGLLDPALQSLSNLFSSVSSTAVSSFNAQINGALNATNAINKEAQAVGGLNQQLAQTQQLTAAGGPIVSDASGAHIGGSTFNSGSNGPIQDVGFGVPQQLPSDGGAVPVLGQRDGGTIIPHFAKGGSFHVPGLGAPDTKLLHLKVSPGEHVTVHTPHQQTLAKKASTTGSHSAHTSPIHHVSVSHHATHAGAKHHAAKIPHFASGGSLTVGNTTDLVTLGLAGISLTDTQASTQSVTGFNAATPGSPTPVTTPSSTPSPASIGTPTYTFTTPTPVGGLQGFTQAQLNALAQYEGQYHIDPFAGTNNMRDQNLAIMRRLYAGIDDYIYDIADRKRAIPVWSNIQSLNADGTETYMNFPDNNPIPPISGFKVTGGSDSLPGSAFGGLKARDGLDFSVPGTGAVDNRMLSMAVSPGEQVAVHAPGSQQGGGAGGRTINQYVNIQASDVDSYNRSKKQLLRDLANRMGSAL
jgi:tape measure domain-containing protein